ncbi:MAG: DMT family transporter [Candidatus Kapabacteria bacterium]|nr:DMT family transporter [Candidatus Kapabacteria bacterium]
MTAPSLRGRGLAALALASILWSTGGLLIKSLPLTSLTIAGGRSAIAALVILAWIRRPFPTWSGAQLGSIVSYMLTVVLFVMATKLTTAANAILLQYTAPIWVALLSALVTRERLTRLDVAAVVAVVVGMGVFFVDRVEAGNMSGNLLAVASGIAFACVALFMRKQQGVSNVESVLFGNILTAVVCLPFAEPFPATADTVVRLLLLGVVQLGVSYILYAWALAHVTALEAVLITMLEPLLNPLWVVIALGEVPSTSASIGGAVVLGTVVVRGIILARRTAAVP